MSKSNEQFAIGVSRTTMAGNIILSVFKLFAGFMAGSSAMISDAIHSLSDVLADIIVMIGIKMSGQKSDKEHPYGHERMECVAGIILSFILFLAGIMIGWGGIQKIIGGNYDELAVPGILALIAAIVSIIVKEAMYWYTLSAAKKLNSVALKASAWHHRSDAMSSVGSFAGILGARSGFPVLDSVSCVLICLFILKVSFDIFKESIDKMTDTACDDAVANEIRSVVLTQKTVLNIDHMQTRMFGNKIYVDMEISVDGSSTLHEAHNTAHIVHDILESRFEKIKHCMVHVNPADTVSLESIGN